MRNNSLQTKMLTTWANTYIYKCNWKATRRPEILICIVKYFINISTLFKVRRSCCKMLDRFNKLCVTGLCAGNSPVTSKVVFPLMTSSCEQKMSQLIAKVWMNFSEVEIFLNISLCIGLPCSLRRRYYSLCIWILANYPLYPVYDFSSYSVVSQSTSNS